jgi:hypothetical protein
MQRWVQYDWSLKTQSQVKPVITNEANKVFKFAGITAGSAAWAVATEGGKVDAAFETAGWK